MNDAPIAREIPVLTDAVSAEELRGEVEPPRVTEELRAQLAHDLHTFLKERVRQQLTNAMAEVIDDLCNMTEEHLQERLKQHLGAAEQSRSPD